MNLYLDAIQFVTFLRFLAKKHFMTFKDLCGHHVNISAITQKWIMKVVYPNGYHT